MPRGRKSHLSKLSVIDLRTELARREQAAGSLMVKRNKLAAEVEAMDAELAELGLHAGAPTPGRRTAMKHSSVRRTSGKRMRNEHPLHEALHNVLKGRTLGIAEMIDGLHKNGFKSTSKNFKVMVAIALSKYKNLFKRVDRGQYTAK